MIEVYYELDKLRETLNKMCECGHTLYQHGFTEHVEVYTGRHFFVVSICIYGDCDGFKEKDPS